MKKMLMLNTSLNVIEGKAAELTFLSQTKLGILQEVFSIKLLHYSNSPHFES